MRATLRCALLGHRPDKTGFITTAPTAWSASRVLRPCLRRGCTAWLEVNR